MAQSHFDPPPVYVGVSGITAPEQAQAILDMWPKSAPPGSLMTGVLTSQKVMTGGERNKRSAAPEDFASIFVRDRRVLGLVHYFTKDTRNLGEQLLHAAAAGGVRCHGVQVNVPWPPPEELEHFRTWGGYERLVLQIGPAAMDGRTVGGISVRAAKYGDIITDVLVDVSGGTGKPIEPNFAAAMVRSLRFELGPDIGITIAGGLSAATLPAVVSLVVEHGLSIDTETKVRTDRDELDLDGEARAYLNAAARMWGWA